MFSFINFQNVIKIWYRQQDNFHCLFLLASKNITIWIFHEVCWRLCGFYTNYIVTVARIFNNSTVFFFQVLSGCDRLQSLSIKGTFHAGVQQSDNGIVFWVIFQPGSVITVKKKLHHSGHGRNIPEPVPTLFNLCK